MFGFDFRRLFNHEWNSLWNLLRSLLVPCFSNTVFYVRWYWTFSYFQTIVHIMEFVYILSHLIHLLINHLSILHIVSKTMCTRYHQSWLIIWWNRFQWSLFRHSFFCFGISFIYSFQFIIIWICHFTMNLKILILLFASFKFTGLERWGIRFLCSVVSWRLEIYTFLINWWFGWRWKLARIWYLNFTFVIVEWNSCAFKLVDVRSNQITSDLFLCRFRCETLCHWIFWLLQKRLNLYNFATRLIHCFNWSSVYCSLFSF